MTTHDRPERTHTAGNQPTSNLYARIVVALDGSAGAELVLPYVEALAEQFGSSVILLHATTSAEVIAASAAAATVPPQAPNIATTPIDPTAVVAAERRAVESELHELAQRLRSRGLAVSYEQHEGAAERVSWTRA
jgi:nucleotide-binding universal stress UspA family protein